MDRTQDVVVYMNTPHNMLHILWITGAVMCGLSLPFPDACGRDWKSLKNKRDPRTRMLVGWR